MRPADPVSAQSVGVGVRSLARASTLQHVEREMLWWKRCTICIDILRVGLRCVDHHGAAESCLQSRVGFTPCFPGESEGKQVCRPATWWGDEAPVYRGERLNEQSGLVRAARDKLHTSNIGTNRRCGPAVLDLWSTAACDAVIRKASGCPHRRWAVCGVHCCRASPGTRPGDELHNDSTASSELKPRRSALRSRGRGRKRAAAPARAPTLSAASKAALEAQAVNHTLILCAGLGSTGTSSVERALSALGLRTAKWGHITTQPGGEEVPSAIMDPLMYGSPRPDFFALFNEVDAVLDSPAVDFLPYLLEAYPRARLIVTHRSARAWAKRRARLHPCAPPPFRSWYTPFRSRGHTRTESCDALPNSLLRHGYEAWYAYVEFLSRSLGVPALHLDVFEEEDEALWSKLILFVRQAGLLPDRVAARLSLRGNKALGSFGKMDFGLN